MIGFLGDFTTFSNFSLDTLSLWQNNQPCLAIVDLFSNMLCCLAAVFVAVHIARTL
jgi:CrcB protein